MAVVGFVVVALFVGVVVWLVAEGDDVASGAGRPGYAGLVAFAACLGFAIAGGIADYRYTVGSITAAGYAIDYAPDGRVRIGIAPTPQPTTVRWLVPDATATGAGE